MSGGNYLKPGLYVSWKPTDGLVAKARELAGRTSGTEAVRAVCQFVTDLPYDHEKAERLRGGRGYVPSPEETFEAGRGICFDKASLLAAMLRSLGIEAKLVIGTVDGNGHAWVSARVGEAWVRCDPTMAESWDKNEMGRHEYAAWDKYDPDTLPMETFSKLLSRAKELGVPDA